MAKLLRFPLKEEKKEEKLYKTFELFTENLILKMGCSSDLAKRIRCEVRDILTAYSDYVDFHLVCNPSSCNEADLSEITTAIIEAGEAHICQVKDLLVEIIILKAKLCECEYNDAVNPA
jgi:hypothetical protein